jgi:hypothetical protein
LLDPIERVDGDSGVLDYDLIFAWRGIGCWLDFEEGALGRNPRSLVGWRHGESPEGDLRMVAECGAGKEER